MDDCFDSGRMEAFSDDRDHAARARALHSDNGFDELAEDMEAPLRLLASRTRPTLAFYGVLLVLAVLAPRVAAFGFLVTSLAVLLRR